MTISLIGVVEENDEVFCVELQTATSDCLFPAIETLFNNAYEAKVGRLTAVTWECGVPGVDRSVVWKATSVRGLHHRYLHISFSDLRTW